jgi:hypothetical protein
MAGSSSTPDRNRELIAFRAPRTLVDEVRKLARRDAETQASTLRRLIRGGLELERRTNHGNEAA